jgi:hypothetical protein
MILRKFGYDTAGLPAVVNDLSLTLLTRSFFEGKTGGLFQVMPGIKSTEDLHYIENDLYYQADSGCAFNASGATTFSKRTITVGKIKIQQEFCSRDLEGFWTERALKAGANYDYIAFEQDIMNLITKKMIEAKETALWKSKIGGGGGLNLIQYDGFIAIIDAASASTINGNPTGITKATGITAANVIGIFDGMWAVLPAKLKRKDDLSFFCDSIVFDLLILALKNANMYHYDGVSATPYQSGVITLPGAGYKVTCLYGLDPLNAAGTTAFAAEQRIYLARTSNFVIGTDLESDEDYFDVRENPITKTMMVDIHFKEGTQVKFPNEIVVFKLV